MKHKNKREEEGSKHTNNESELEINKERKIRRNKDIKKKKTEKKERKAEIKKKEKRYSQLPLRRSSPDLGSLTTVPKTCKNGHSTHYRGLWEIKKTKGTSERESWCSWRRHAEQTHVSALSCTWRALTSVCVHLATTTTSSSPRQIFTITLQKHRKLQYNAGLLIGPARSFSSSHSWRIIALSFNCENQLASWPTMNIGAQVIKVINGKRHTVPPTVIHTLSPPFNSFNE